MYNVHKKYNLVFLTAISFHFEQNIDYKINVTKIELKGNGLSLCYLQSSSDDVDSKRIKKLAKELLALERAYALLQAHVGSAVDAERDEMVNCIKLIHQFKLLSIVVLYSNNKDIVKQCICSILNFIPNIFIFIFKTCKFTMKTQYLYH